MWIFLTQKVDFLNLTLNPPSKTPFLAHFVTKADLMADLEWCVAPPAPPWLQAYHTVVLG